MATTTVAPWRVFPVRVRQVHWLRPSFRRLTLTGAELDRFADNGFDQRCKLVLPLPDAGIAHLPTGPDWYKQWRALPQPHRNPIRTYTVRAVRAQRHEIDVDMVCHGDGGPGSRFAATAGPGDELAVVGPDVGFPGEHGGVEFRPPAGTGTVLIAADETAVPAVCAILEQWPRRLTGEVLLEVPDREDPLPVAQPQSVSVRWLPRDGEAPGSRLVPAVRAAASRLFDRTPTDLAADAGGAAAGALVEPDIDRELLWEVPDRSVAGAGRYAWLAGEAAAIRTLRRHLVAERGLDRRQVAFMGYWRLGRAEL